MSLFRVVVALATVVAVALTPLVARGFDTSFEDLATRTAVAQTPGDPGRLYQQGNFNDNGDGDDDDDDNDNDGDDDDDDDNGNGNDNDDDDGGDDDDDNGNDNDDGDDNDNVGPTVGVGESRTGMSKCFDVQEVGLVQQQVGDGDVTISVPPDAGFSAVTRLTLRQVDLGSVPAPPSGSFLDSLVWSLDAQSGCDGSPIAQLPGGVNLGITYRVSADKSKLRIVYLQNGQWTNVTTVPDPAAGNPYISATINSAGVYAVVQTP